MSRYIKAMVRFRTIGNVACTGCVESTVSTVAEVVVEIAMFRLDRAQGRPGLTTGSLRLVGKTVNGKITSDLMTTLLWFASVADGNSALIGSLLCDSKAVVEDQWASVEQTSQEREHEHTDLAPPPMPCGRRA